MAFAQLYTNHAHCVQEEAPISADMQGLLDKGRTGAETQHLDVRRFASGAKESDTIARLETQAILGVPYYIICFSFQCLRSTGLFRIVARDLK